MKIVQPKVILLAATSCGGDLEEGWKDFLETVGAPEWTTDSESQGEGLIEASGRMCYRSWKPGLNPNVTKVREGNKDYIGNILKQGHGSVLEHANTTWALLNVSRVFTHELCRHRAGTAISQESLRYVRLTDIPFADSILHAEENSGFLASETVLALEEIQRILAEEIFELDKEKEFAVKKKYTSAMRRLAPLGLATNMIWTCNLRELRHVIALRTALGAEEEIRKVIGMVAEIVVKRYPAVFQDFTKQVDGSWVPEHWKV